MMGILAVPACTELSSEEPYAAPDSGTFAWFDLGSDNPDASRDFYKGLFGWSFTSRRGDDYWLISANGAPIGGMFAISASDSSGATGSQWIPVFAVDDAIETSKRAFAMGARQISVPAQSSDGIYSSIRDTTGAALDLYQGDAGYPLSESGSAGTWVWADHFSSSPSRASAFYSTLLGYGVGRSEGGGRTLQQDGKDIAGLVFAPKSQIEPNWLPYVAVPNLDETLAKARSLGGRLVVRNGDAAVLLGPTGAAIGVIAGKD